MASGSDAEQEQKRAAAAAYDYDGDARWADYWSNVLVPPNLASRPDVIDHFKRKSGVVSRVLQLLEISEDRDLVVEPMSSTGSTQPSRPDVRSSSSTSSDNVRARSSGSSSRTATPQPPPAQTGSAATPLQFDARTIHFSINAWVLVVAGLGMLPILPKHLADRACKLSLLGTAFSSGYSLYSIYGRCLLATSNVHFVTVAALPVFCWALDHVARFLRRNFARSSFYRKYLEEPCLWVETNNTTLSLLSSNAEIALGFLLIISLFSWRRSIIQTFMYWQVLKLMYHAPVTASYHQSAWAKIGRIVNPYIHRYAPFLQTLISAIQRWWFRPCASRCSSSSSCSSSWMMQAKPPKQSHNPLSRRLVSSESLAVLALHLLLKRHKYNGGNIVKTPASSSGVLQITENKSSSLTKLKVNVERIALDDALDRNKQLDRLNKEMSYWVDMGYTNSNLQYSLLMKNLDELETSLAGEELPMLEKDILVHIEQLGALKLFNESMSMATLDTLTQTSYESDCALLDEIIKLDPETPLTKVDDTEVIVRSGKSLERKLKRMRASEKASGECANLEKIRENMVKEGQEVSYQRWAEEAGVDEAVLKSRLEAGYCCRERLLVTTEWLVKYIARSYTGMGTAFDDLLQAGKMGVLDGAEKFNSEKGCKFSTYVKYWIRKGMLALLAENSGVTLLPARMESIIRKVKEARRAIRYSAGRNPSDSEIAAMIGVSVANVKLARKCSRRVVSLYTEIGLGQPAKYTEVIPDTSLEAPDEAIFRSQLRERLLLVLDKLPAREGRVLKLRHGLEDGKCRSLEQIGGIYRVSKEWIRKIEKSAMSKLRNEDVRRELDDFRGF
ncbi:hypothetical protein EJB05_52572, partial [Eragrostis curvula]